MLLATLSHSKFESIQSAASEESGKKLNESRMMNESRTKVKVERKIKRK